MCTDLGSDFSHYAWILVAENSFLDGGNDRVNSSGAFLVFELGNCPLL